MGNIHLFPKQIRDYGDLWHAVMEICMKVQFDGHDHLDATAEIFDLVEEHKELL